MGALTRLPSDRVCQSAQSRNDNLNRDDPLPVWNRHTSTVPRMWQAEALETSVVTEIRTSPWHCGIFQRCSNLSRLLHMAFHALNVRTNFGVFYGPRVPKLCKLLNPLFRAAVMAMLPLYSFTPWHRFSDRARALRNVALAPALACHWPGPGVIIPRNSKWKAACPVTITSEFPAGSCRPQARAACH